MTKKRALEIISQLKQCRLPLVCAHGRPTVMKVLIRKTGCYVYYEQKEYIYVILKKD